MTSVPDRQSPDDISVLRALSVLLRHRHVIVLVSFTVAVAVVGISLMLPSVYTATSSITPESGQGQTGRLAGLATQFGIAVPTGQSVQSPQFYADLLTGRALLRETAVTEYEVRSDREGTDAESRQRDLVSVLGVEADTRNRAEAKTIEVLRDEVVAVTTDPETGVVELSVTTRWPELSRQIAERMIDLVNRFNLERRQSQASAERKFLDDQTARAKSALHAVEDSLQRFLEQNRNYQNSPALRFRHDRLQRRVTLRQQVFTSLSESLQQARIDEVRNTPVITVVQPPELPARPDSRRLMLKGVLGLMLGGMLGLFWAFGREMVATTREQDPDDYAEFERLKREMVDELRGLWRRVRGVVR